MKTVNITIIIIISISCFGQGKWSRRAEIGFEHKRYYEVIQNLEHLEDSSLTQRELAMKAISYLNMHDYSSSLNNFERLDSETLSSDSLRLLFAETLEYNDLPERALSQYLLIQGQAACDICDIRIKAIQANDIHGEKNKGLRIWPLNINTTENDFVGFTFGNELVFLSGGYGHSNELYQWDGQHYLDYYRIDSSKVKGVSLFHIRLTSNLHEGPGVYDNENQRLYFTRNDVVHDHGKNERLSNLKIYQSDFTNNTWSAPIELPFNDEDYSRGHPTLSRDGRTMVFSSNEMGGLGKSDLMISFLVNHQWTVPRNMGLDINTSQLELFPYLADDSTLIFSSNGFEGYGGLDLYKARLNPDFSVESIENMGGVFNSSHDDFGLVYDNESMTAGYFSSDRTSGLGSSDIYRFDFGAPDVVCIHVIDQLGVAVDDVDVHLDGRLLGKTREGDILMRELPIQGFRVISSKEFYDSAEFVCSGDQFIPDTIKLVMTRREINNLKGTVIDHATKLPVEGMLISARVNNVYVFDTTDAKGSWRLPIDTSSYVAVKMERKGYLTREIETSTDQVVVSTEAVFLEQGLVLSFENIYYDYDSDLITEKAKPTLDSLVKVMNLNPRLEIEVSSHADSRGDEVYNETLSLKRAASVISYMKKTGIRIDRLYIKYYGESRLVNDCGDSVGCNESFHSLNRRTEFRVVKF